jgi:hypothetical protein
MSCLVNRIKAVNAPKTEDAHFDEANAAFQSQVIDLAELRESLGVITKSIGRLASTSAKLAEGVSAWLAEGDQESQPYAGAAADLGRYSGACAAQTGEFFEARLAPNFFEPLAAHERRVAEAAKLRTNRGKAVADFDRDRELLRLAETAKKPKQAEIAKARQKCEDSNARYEAANTAFIEAVEQLYGARLALLGDPFKRLFAVFVQFVRQVTPEPGAAAPAQRVARPPRASPPATRLAPPAGGRPGALQPQASFARIDDDIDFKRGGWEESGVGFRAPAPPASPPKAAPGKLVNPFEETDSSAWDAQLAAAKLSDPLGDGTDTYNPFD